MTDQLKKWRRVGVVATAGASATFVAVFVYAAARFGPTRASAWFQGEAVILAIVATGAAALAALFAYPSFRDLREQLRRAPDVRLSLEVGDNIEDRHVVENSGWIAGGRYFKVSNTTEEWWTFEARVGVHNSGDKALDYAILNILVPEACIIHPIDEGIDHYSIPGNALDGDILPGQSRPVRLTVANLTAQPGIVRMFHVRISTPTETAIPMLVRLAAPALQVPLIHRAELRPVGRKQRVGTRAVDGH